MAYDKEEGWLPKKFLECKLCGDVVYSKYPGQYVNCKCKFPDKGIAVDETSCYARIIGSRFKILRVKPLHAAIAMDLHYLQAYDDLNAMDI
jgi:hypothetical protein